MIRNVVVSILFLLFLVISIGCGGPDKKEVSKPDKYQQGQIVYIKPDYREAVVVNVWHYSQTSYDVRYYVQNHGYETISIGETGLSESPKEKLPAERN